MIVIRKQLLSAILGALQSSEHDEEGRFDSSLKAKPDSIDIVINLFPRPPFMSCTQKTARTNHFKKAVKPPANNARARHILGLKKSETHIYHREPNTREATENRTRGRTWAEEDRGGPTMPPHGCRLPPLGWVRRMFMSYLLYVRVLFHR